MQGRCGLNDKQDVFPFFFIVYIKSEGRAGTRGLTIIAKTWKEHVESKKLLETSLGSLVHFVLIRSFI